MKLTFLGTRGEIESRTQLHRRHTALAVDYRRRRVMIDCGTDWTNHIDRVRPRAIVITHAHPDHAWGLRAGAPCPVYATPTAWETMANYPIEHHQTLADRSPTAIEGMTFEAFPVEHSTRCPAVGYRIAAGNVTIFYVPDVVYIQSRQDALVGCRLYVGDGATLKRPMVRKRGEHLIGHSPVRTQLTWCEKEGVPEAIFTHCGAQIVDGDEPAIQNELNRWATARNVKARIAHDGLEVVLK